MRIEGEYLVFDGSEVNNTRAWDGDEYRFRGYNGGAWPRDWLSVTGGGEYGVDDNYQIRRPLNNCSPELQEQAGYYASALSQHFI
jgi:hypothetical protein